MITTEGSTAHLGYFDDAQLQRRSTDAVTITTEGSTAHLGYFDDAQLQRRSTDAVTITTEGSTAHLVYSTMRSYSVGAPTL
jgi:hypothetical protein